MHSGKWGLPRKTNALLNLQHLLVIPVRFSFVLPPFYNSLFKTYYEKGFLKLITKIPLEKNSTISY